MLVGIHTSSYGEALQEAPDLKVGRTFHGANKTTDTADHFVTQLKGDCESLVAIGMIPYPSWKFPPADVVAGKCDAQVIAGLKYLQSLTLRGAGQVYTTSWHEPENDMPAKTFVKMFDYLYALKEKHAPSVKMGVVNMGYQWRSVQARPAADQKAWMSFKKADFIHTDVYSGNGELLSGMPKWKIWLNAVQQYTLVKTIGLAERGYNAKGDQVEVMKADQKYLDELKLIGLNVDMFLYWNSMDTNGKDSYKLSAAGFTQLAKFAKEEAMATTPTPPPPPTNIKTHRPNGTYVVCDKCLCLLEDVSKAEAHYNALHPFPGQI